MRLPPSARRTAAAALLAAVAVACTAPAVSTELPEAAGAGPDAAAGTHPPITPRPAPIARRNFDPAIRARLDALVASAEQLAGRPVAIAVLNEDGGVVYEHRGEELLLPASTLKIVTAAAALVRLGPDHRFRTSVAATAAPDGGVVDGDLVLVGGGDPALATATYQTQVYPDRPRTPLEALADEVVARGVRTVTGQVVGDTSLFHAEPVARGWPQRYLDDRDATPITGLAIDAGVRFVHRPDGTLVGEASPDPPGDAAVTFARLLAERGVHVAGGTRVSTTPVATVTTVATVDSAPLLDLLQHTLRESDNHMADTIFRGLGAAAGDPTWAGSQAAAAAALAGLGLDWRGVRLADGSGLSREDRLSASLLARLDLAVARSPFGTTWRRLLAVAGENGTLEKRLVGTRGAGRLFGKTGTLDDVRALVGRVEGDDGRAYHFAVLANDLQANAWRIRELEDELALAMVGHLDGCTREELPPADPPPSPPPLVAPYQLVCPG